jgi:hypothetical protein
MKIFSLLMLMLSFIEMRAQYRVELLDSTTFQLGEGVILSKTSFRGLSVVDKYTIWVSGSRGTIARSIDGGKSFRFKQLKGYEKSDFRDIEAFDAKNAIIMSSGSPAYILKTTDGGETWKEVYKNKDSAYFLDGMDFWDEKKGVIVGDPINGVFVVLKTNDGGETWTLADVATSPKALEGEAIFAASGTSIKCLKNERLGFVTGGMHTRFIWQSDSCKPVACWRYDSLPITHGKNSTGAFAIAMDRNFAIAVGGDYTNDTLVTENSAGTNYYPGAWFKPHSSVQEFNGYRSGVEIINKDAVIACGTSGVDINKGICAGGGRLQRVSKISSEGYHVVKKAKKGKVIYLAGPKGKIARLVKSQ